MAINIRKFLEGIKIVPKASSTVDETGELEVISASGKLNYRNNVDANPVSPVVTEAHSATLTNKTIDGDNNTIQDVGISSLKTVLADADKVIRRDVAGAVVSGNSLPNSSQIVTLDSSDTLTNKTIDGDNNTLQDVGISSLKTVLADANKVIRRDASGAVTSGNALPNSSQVVTLDSSDTLTNKTLTSPVLNTPTADTITGIAGGALTVQSASNQNLSLQAQGTGVVSLESLSISGNTITGDTGSTLTVTTANNQNLTLSANGTGVVNVTQPFKVSNVSIEDSVADATSGSNASLATPTRSVVRLTAAGTLASVDMIPAGSDGQRLILINTTGASVSINDNTGATVANRIRTGTGAALTLAANASIGLVYNGTTSYWMIIGGIGSGGGGGSSNTVIDALASSEATLTTAISSLSATGGIIGISASFSVTSAVSIPNGIILVGHGINSPTITFGVGGSFTLGTQSQIRDLNFGASKTSGTLLTMSGDKVTIDKVRFSVTSTNALTCIQVTGSANLIYRTIFSGVVGGTAVGIDYASGTGNNDSYCIFE